MRKLGLLLVLALASCSTAGSTVDPIPGSITYGGQPRERLVKSPAGSTFSHSFRTGGGRLALETYRIEPDRSLTLLRREIISDYPEN
ncbi:hypothetical protein [Rhizobium rhizogenes]|uniref:Transmembrane protein n=1 Tax=Rhizobium rhizogenes TaxID=359 RepID=A0AA92HB11_RHIRH|nr:hypothetical protein [Rhizobium rhizogenes]PVE57051.1 hypothetical protein DC430_04720 [Rhizobium rhizogenes]PVE68436.1 hypothetical protein DC415_01495 [Agrobacterium tumefaciens]PVE78184.1 hypothetical protein DCP16_01495 [Sphingomonas sp. TPD3009]